VDGLIQSDRSFSVDAPNSGDTVQAGERFAARLVDGDVVFLSGEMGAGKTTFTQGIARGLGIRDTIQSPTFTLISEYSPGTRGLELVHIDLYRLESDVQIDSLGLDEYLDRYGSVTVIEWPERLADAVRLSGWHVHIAYSADGGRLVSGDYR
jgi:tRNA threonylcarbamoyladenosine biosynthesis protein TsaE